MQRLCELCFFSINPSILRNEEETLGQKDVHSKIKEAHEEQKSLMYATPPLPHKHRASPGPVSMLAFTQSFSDKRGDYVDLRNIIAYKNNSLAVIYNKSFTLLLFKDFFFFS